MIRALCLKTVENSCEVLFCIARNNWLKNNQSVLSAVIVGLEDDQVILLTELSTVDVGTFT